MEVKGVLKQIQIMEETAVCGVSSPYATVKKGIPYVLLGFDVDKTWVHLPMPLEALKMFEIGQEYAISVRPADVLGVARYAEK